MKIHAMMAVAAVLAVTATGCRYDKANDGGKGLNDGDISNIETDAEASEGVISSERPFEDYCTLCTDVSFAPVYFGFDSTLVPSSEQGKIDEVCQHLKGNGDRVVVIGGHCDERGSNEYNLSLGENRAVILRNYLVQNAIDASRIQTRSYGEDKPAVEGHDESAWSKNRRGEFLIYKK